MNQRFEAVDKLRGLAILSVVIFHYTIWYNHNYHHDFTPWEPLRYLAYGVHLFFIISGLVICMNIDKYQNQAEFIKARIIRLYPALWVAMTITLVSVWFLGPENRSVGPLDVLGNVFLIHEFFYLDHVDGVYWSLVIEMLFYVLFGLLTFSVQSPWIKKLFYVTVMIYAVIFVVIDAPGKGPWYVLFEKLPNYLPLFLTGICIYKLFIEKHDRLFFGALFVACLAYVPFLHFGPQKFIVYLWIALVVLSVTRGEIINAFQPLAFFGSISYSLYLVHQNLGYGIISALYDLGIPGPWAVAIAFIIAVAVAMLLHYFVEKPCLRYLRTRKRQFKNA